MTARAEQRKTIELKGIRIGRVAGVDIQIHWGWLIIFAFLTWSLSDRVFRDAYDDWPLAAGLLAGALTTMLFFGSVFLHEVAHAVVGTRQGMKAKSITLLIFGGATSFEGEAERPRQELLLSLAGPMTSLMLAAVFAAVGLLLRGSPGGTAALLLAAINAILGVFNLLPALPLDGGRVFRSAVWARKGDLIRAAQVASWVGTGIAFALMGAGAVVLVATEAFVSGVWLLIIGWFLYSQAKAGYRHVLEREQEAVEAPEKKAA